MNVTETLTSFIRDHFAIGDDPDFGVDVHLFEEGFVDSLGATEIVFFAEKTFGVKITQKDIILYPMNTVREIASVVEQKLAES